MFHLVASNSLKMNVRPMVFMKSFRLIVIFFFIFSFSSFSYGVETGKNETAFPDLLGDEFSEEEDFEEQLGFVIHDPLEPLNRFFFEFNDELYNWVLKPATDGYIWLLPRDLRECVGNFFFHLSMPVRLLNTVLQGDIKGSGVVLGRFLINSSLGVYGLVDIAVLEFDIKPRRGDFGQTLGRWGLGEGVYFCWPLLGPSNMRDSVGLVVDAYTHPVPYFHESRALDVAYYTTNRVNLLSLNPDIYEDLVKYSLDPYIASRQAYYEFRQSFIEKR